jgi:hypothetical protein
MRKVHRILSVVGGLFRTVCGRYVEGPNVTAYHKGTTCKSCRRNTWS